jgi:CubicO group peptidase (beta-lactamase class C family)
MKMRRVSFFVLIVVLSGCFGKSSIVFPKGPLDPVGVVDTVCTSCNANPPVVEVDTLVELDVCDIVFGQPEHGLTYSPASQKVRKSFFNFLKSHGGNYDNSVMMYLGRSDSTVYCYRQGKYNSDTQLPIMSATKLVTATVLMTLVEEGKLKLDDQVSKYLISFRSSEKHNITLRQLLTHTSGIIGDSPFDHRSNMTLAEAVDSIGIRTKLLFVPGTRSTYGSASFKVASRVAEVVEMKPWAQIFQERVGSKCGLEKVVYSPSYPLNPATGSGIVCSMNEYLRFLMMMYNKGSYNGIRVLKKNSVEEMEKDNTNGIDPTYGLGLFRAEIVNDVSKEVACLSAAGVHGWINREKNYYGLIFTQAGFDKTIETNLEFRQLVRSQL